MEAMDVNLIYSRKVLNKALTILDSSKRTYIDDPEVKDVGMTTKAMILKLIKEVTRDNKDYKVSDVLDAGSYYEGTKLGFPDEFDFMIVFDIGDFEVKTGCAKGLVEIQLTTDDSKRDAEKNGAYVKNLTGQFRITFSQLVSDLIFSDRKFECQGQFGSISLGHWSYPVLQLIWTNRKTGETTRIKIDLMPAVGCPKEYTNHLLDTLPPKRTHVIKKQGLYLVPKTCPRCPKNSCWHISFARAEAFLMRQLDALHKAAYRLLKYLVQVKQPDVDEVVGGITSYSIKNALLHHVHTFGCVKSTDLADCLISILCYLDQCYTSLKMPLFFVDTWCMFRLGSLAFCKLDTVTVVQTLTPESKTLLLCEGQEQLCLLKENDGQCAWEFLIWIEYQRRYVSLILSVIGNCLPVQKSEYFDDDKSSSQAETTGETDTMVAIESENFIRGLKSLVTMAKMHQPSCALSFDFMESEELISVMKNDRSRIYINDFQDLKEEAEKLFKFKCEVNNAGETWPSAKREDSCHDDRLLESARKPKETITYARNRDMYDGETIVTDQTSVADRNCVGLLAEKYSEEDLSGPGLGNVLSESAPQCTKSVLYSRKRDTCNDVCTVTDQNPLADTKCFEFLSENNKDVAGSVVTIATVRSTKLTPQLYLVQLNNYHCGDESLSPGRFFSWINNEILKMDDSHYECEMDDDDIDFYLSSLVETLEAKSSNEKICIVSVPDSSG